MSKEIEALEPAFFAAAKNIERYLSGKTPSDKLDMDRIRLSGQTIGQFQRLHGSLTARGAVRLAAAKAIAKDAEDLKEMIVGGVKDTQKLLS